MEDLLLASTLLLLIGSNVLPAVGFAGMLALVLVYVTALQRRESLDGPEGWQAFAAGRSLWYDPLEHRVEGLLEDHPFEVFVERWGGDERPVTVLALHGLPEDLTVHRGHQGEPVGDRRFDARVQVRPRSPEALGRLTADVRENLRLPVAAGSMWLHEGVLVSRLRGQPSRQVLERRVQRMLEVARGMRATQPLEQTLLRNALHDPQRGVRLRNLRQLLRHGGPLADRAVAATAGVRDAAVQLLRAWYRRDWRSVAEIAGDRRQRAPLRREAVGLLLTADPASIEAGLRRVWRAGADRFHLHLLEHLRRRGDRLARTGACTWIDTAASLRAWELRQIGSDEREAAVLCCEVLGRLGAGDPRAEEALLKLVDVPSRQIRVAAIRALGSVGTVRSVQAIHRFTEPRLLFTELRSCAVRSVRAIQERIDGAERGSLSVAETGERGRLSLESLRGRLSPAR